MKKHDNLIYNVINVLLETQLAEKIKIKPYIMKRNGWQYIQLYMILGCSSPLHLPKAYIITYEVVMKS